MAPDRMGGSGPIIPYGGRLSGFMPYRMGDAASGLSFSSRNSSAIGTGRSSFRLSSMTAGIPMSPSAFGQSLGRREVGSLFSTEIGGGMGRTMETGRAGVMPPNFGYPFYQPPSPLPVSSAAIGSSPM
jgi:hypothetical protein